MRPLPFLPGATLVCIGLLGLLPLSPLGAQVRELSVELGGSSVRPPAGLEGDAASFMVAGLRAMNYDLVGSGFMASFQAGRSLKDGAGGDFLSGTLDGSYWHYFAPGWSVGAEARGFGFDVVDPFPYRAIGVEGGPGIRYSGRRLSASLKGVAGTGWSRTELLPYGDEPALTLEEDLWRVGATADVLAGSPRMMVGVGAGIHDSPGGAYRSLGGRVLLKGKRAVVEFSVDAWDTPLGNEVTGGVGMAIPMKGWSLRGFVGKTEPDPLTLAEPGGGAGGLMVGRRILGSDPLPMAPPPLHRLLEFEELVARIQVRIQAPKGIEKMELMGDFTLWEPLSMTRDDDEWVVEVAVPEGIHHYGFLADGDWYLPENAPDAVADDWGRKNATMVIER